MCDIQIRRALLPDLPEIVDLWLILQEVTARYERRLAISANAADWFEDHLRDQIEGDSPCVIVAIADDCMAGYAYGQVLRRPTLAGGDCGYIADLCVRESYRGRGIGRRLYQTLRATFIALGLASIEVQVVRANPASQAFWRKMGFADFLRTLRLDLG
jgi:ribosomal protein S18 acetylase RimI-like enzyme